MFRAQPSKGRSKKDSFSTPSLLGTFFVFEQEVLNLIRSLRSLVATMKNVPLSCQIQGDIIDFRKPLGIVKERLLQFAKAVADVPYFTDGLETLNTIGIRYVRKPGKLAATTIEGYRESGPHRKILCT